MLATGAIHSVRAVSPAGLQLAGSGHWWGSGLGVFIATRRRQLPTRSGRSRVADGYSSQAGYPPHLPA